MQILKKIIQKIFFFAFKDQQETADLWSILYDQKIATCYKSVTIGIGSKFGIRALVNNMSNNESSIYIGNNTLIDGNLLVFSYGGRIEIGDFCYIGENTRIWSGEKIVIGNNVFISHNVNIIDSNSHELDEKERALSFKLFLKNGYPSEKGNVKTAAIIISDHAWISYNVSIMKGITIGEGAILAAGSVVTKDVEPYTLVAGNPAVFIKKLKESQ